jgi:hypothetical protein
MDGRSDFVIEKDVLTHSRTLMQPFRRAALVLFSPSFSAPALDDIPRDELHQSLLLCLLTIDLLNPCVIMSSPANANSEGSSFKPFTKAERIRQLNDIDKAR